MRAQTKQIGYIIKGNLAWNSGANEWIQSDKGLRFKSNRYEPIGKHIMDNPVRSYLQMYMNNYEIWGTLPIEINPEKIREAEPIIKNAMHKMTGIVNSLSFLTGTSIEWLPAYYGKIIHRNVSNPPLTDEYESWDCVGFRKSQNEGITKNIQDNYFRDNLFPFIQIIDSLPNDPINYKTIIETSLSYHSYGNRFASGLYRFIAYWNSIELLGNWYYDTLYSKENKADKRKRVMAVLKTEVIESNCLEKIRKCSEIVNPTARTKITKYLEKLDPSSELCEKIFSRDNPRKETLLDIRNKIAHGKISEYDFEYIGELNERIHDVHSISKEIIIQSINKSKRILT